MERTTIICDVCGEEITPYRIYPCINNQIKAMYRYSIDVEKDLPGLYERMDICPECYDRIVKNLKGGAGVMAKEVENA